jgi:aminoglycoside N3'-acetyltransferase
VTVRELLYAAARRVLDQRARDRLNARLARGRKAVAPLLRRLHGTFDAAALRAELERVLPARFDALMVHCAFDDLLPMYTGGVGALLDALRALCGPERTLVMPAFTFLVPGRDVVDHLSRNPRFDARRQPSQMGLLSEVFRRTPGVVRSLHPTHSVCALGPLARDLTAGHHRATTIFGGGTPFARMAELDCVILGLGKPFYRVLTQSHVPEDLLGDRFPVRRTFREVDVVLVDAEGEHPHRLRADTTPVERRLHRLRRLLEPGDLTEWRFHGVPLFWTRAGRVTDAMCEAALRGRTIYAGPTLA